MQNTSDLSDKFHPNIEYLDSIYKIYGANKNFSGEVYTIKCFEDNSLVKEVLSTKGDGKVLVVDAGGSKRCAMLGDQIASKAIKNNWSGIVIYGLIRDSELINQMPIGVRALGTHPLKSLKKGVGEKKVELYMSGARLSPGDILYADQDGIIIIKDRNHANT